jgi:hypothetical protein
VLLVCSNLTSRHGLHVGISNSLLETYRDGDASNFPKLATIFGSGAEIHKYFLPNSIIYGNAVIRSSWKSVDKQNKLRSIVMRVARLIEATTHHLCHLVKEV